MIKYKEWLIGEGKTKMYELYLNGPGIAPIADKVLGTIKGVVSNAKSHLVVKFSGTKEELNKVERAVADAGFVVIDSEIEHD